MHQAGVMALFRCGLRDVHRICWRRSPCCCCCTSAVYVHVYNEFSWGRERQLLHRPHNMLKGFVKLFKPEYWPQSTVSSAFRTVTLRNRGTGVTISSGGGMPDRPGSSRPICNLCIVDPSCPRRKIHTGKDSQIWYCGHVSDNYKQRSIYRKSHIRHKSKGRKTTRTQKESDDESSDEEISDWMESLEEEEEESQDVAGAPSNFSQVRVHMKAPRADAVASAGLNMARNKVDDLFYKSRLLLNGEKLLKKSVKMDVGDFVDVVTGTKEEETMAKRVQIVRIMKEKTKTDKLIVILHVWKSEFPVSAEDTTDS